MAATGWGKSKTYEVLDRAEELGNVAEGDRRGLHSLLNTRSESPLHLPVKIRLSAANFRISSEIPPQNFRNSAFPSMVVGGSVSGKAEEGPEAQAG